MKSRIFGLGRRSLHCGSFALVSSQMWEGLPLVLTEEQIEQLRLFA